MRAVPRRRARDAAHCQADRYEGYVLIYDERWRDFASLLAAAIDAMP